MSKLPLPSFTTPWRHKPVASFLDPGAGDVSSKAVRAKAVRNMAQRVLAQVDFSAHGVRFPASLQPLPPEQDRTLAAAASKLCQDFVGRSEAYVLQDAATLLRGRGDGGDAANRYEYLRMMMIVAGVLCWYTDPDDPEGPPMFVLAHFNITGGPGGHSMSEVQRRVDWVQRAAAGEADFVSAKGINVHLIDAATPQELIDWVVRGESIAEIRRSRAEGRCDGVFPEIMKMEREAAKMTPAERAQHTKKLQDDAMAAVMASTGMTGEQAMGLTLGDLAKMGMETFLQDLVVGPRGGARKEATCDYCGTASATRGLLRCSRCKQVAYCNATCQRAAYRAHRGPCRSAKAAMAVAAR